MKTESYDEETDIYNIRTEQRTQSTRELWASRYDENDTAVRWSVLRQTLSAEGAFFDQID